MTESDDILGYVVCHTCKHPKAIKQGKGKRSAFVHGRCDCGPDTRTGKAAQAEMKAFQPLEAVQAQIDVMNQPESLPIQTEKQTENKPNPETKPEAESKPMTTLACMGLGGALGVVFGGLIKAIKVVS